MWPKPVLTEETVESQGSARDAWSGNQVLTCVLLGQYSVGGREKKKTGKEEKKEEAREKLDHF